MANSNKALIFDDVPSGLPVVGKDLAVRAVEYGADGACPEGGVFLQSLYASIDPYQRGRMRAADVKSYMPPYPLGEPINGRSIAKVLRSRSDKFREGDFVIGILPMQEYVAYDEAKLFLIKQLDNPLGIEDVRVFLGVLGVPGVTGYAGLYEIGQPQKGQTIFISAASGAVGSMVGQLAKLEGLTTIGSVGSDEKLKFITKELGFDAAFNYKTEKPDDALARLAPDGLDIYFDNVGGEHLEAAITHMKDFGRIAMCGTISEYNQASPEHHYPLRNYSLVFSKRLTVRGFICSDKGFMDKWGQEHQERVQKWVKEGTVKPKIWETQGIDNSPEAFLDLFSGRNFGKAVLAF